MFFLLIVFFYPTIIVSYLYNRIGLGIELDHDYCKLSKEKILESGIKDVITI